MRRNQCCWSHASLLLCHQCHSWAHCTSIRVTEEEDGWIIPPTGFCSASPVLLALGVLTWHTKILILWALLLYLTTCLFPRFLYFRSSNFVLLGLLATSQCFCYYPGHFFATNSVINWGSHSSAHYRDFSSPLSFRSTLDGVLVWQNYIYSNDYILCWSIWEWG